MHSTTVYICLVLASIAVYSAHAFTSQVPLTNTCRQAASSSAMFGKRSKLKKKVKKIFKGDGEEGAAAKPQTQSNFDEGQKVKMSNGQAKNLAKKYKDIDDLGERTYQILVDLKMVGNS